MIATDETIELNRIYHEDCLTGIRRIQNKSVKLVTTDPPYFLGMTHNGKKGSFTDLNICAPFYSLLTKEIKRVLMDDGEFYIFTDWRGYAFYYPIFSNILPVKNLIVWDKKSGPGTFYNYSHELILYGCMDSSTVKSGSNVWRETSFASGSKSTNGEKVHPAQKPTELIEKMILNSSEANDTVLDCFMGSGTTAIACINTDRKYLGFEIDQSHFETASARIDKHLKDLHCLREDIRQQASEGVVLLTDEIKLISKDNEADNSERLR